jgi:hypothetical protein
VRANEVEDANIKLDSVFHDVMGKSGRFQRIEARRCPKQAITPVIASILAVCHMLREGTTYHDLGCDAPLHRPAKKRLLKGLTGYAIELKQPRCMGLWCCRRALGHGPGGIGWNGLRLPNV